jgi:hypothetical protein
MRGRNKTPAERALELVCAKAGISFAEFQVLLSNSQGDKANERPFPETSYQLVEKNYLPSSALTQEDWLEIFNHLKSPNDNFGKN